MRSEEEIRAEIQYWQGVLDGLAAIENGHTSKMCDKANATLNILKWVLGEKLDRQNDGKCQR